MEGLRLFMVLFGGDLQVGEVAFGSGADPEGDSTFVWVEFEVVDDEAGLLRAVDVEPGLAAFHFDFVLGPDTGLEVDV